MSDMCEFVLELSRVKSTIGTNVAPLVSISAWALVGLTTSGCGCSVHTAMHSPRFRAQWGLSKLTNEVQKKSGRGSGRCSPSHTSQASQRLTTGQERRRWDFWSNTRKHAPEDINDVKALFFYRPAVMYSGAFGVVLSYIEVDRLLSDLAARTSTTGFVAAQKRLLIEY